MNVLGLIRKLALKVTGRQLKSLIVHSLFTLGQEATGASGRYVHQLYKGTAIADRSL